MKSDDVPLRRLRLRRPTDTLTDRLWVLRKRWRLLLRLSIATSGAFFVATVLLGHQQAFFAPIAAVIVLIAGAGLRGSTLWELVVGVAVGVLAVVVSTLVGLKGLALTQAANSSVLLAAVIPVAGAGNPAVTRFLDALVGGLVGLATVLLIPRNPVRDIDREVQRILRNLSTILQRLSQSIRTVDPELAADQLEQAREMTPQVEAMTSTAANVSEVARMSPMRWRQRDHVETYVATVRDLDNAVRDVRVLCRRMSSMLRFGEQPPAGLDLALDQLARAIEIFADDLSEHDDFEEARTALVEAARLASTALTDRMTINSATIAAQIRSLAADLLYASGSTRDEIDDRLDFR